MHNIALYEFPFRTVESLSFPVHNKYGLIYCAIIGWGLGKKCLPIDCGILAEYADIYRRLLGQKNPGPYFIKLRAVADVVLWYYNHYNGNFA